MSSIIIHTLWITRTYDEDWSPELLVAWDEYDVDANREGWEEAKTTVLAGIGNEVGQWREILFSIPNQDIRRAFEPPMIKVE